VPARPLDVSRIADNLGKRRSIDGRPSQDNAERQKGNPRFRDMIAAEEQLQEGHQAMRAARR
jgi:hypothetical protein